MIAKKHGGIQETFTVRRMSHGVGVERVFPLHSPVVESVTVIREGKVRRASFTISETVSARPPASRKPANNFQMGTARRDKQLSLFAVFHRERNRRQEGLSWRITERTGRKARRPRNPQKGISPFVELYEWIESAVLAVVFVILLFTFGARTSVVSGSSMIDTLHDGDMLFISRWGFSADQGDIVVVTKPYEDNEPLLSGLLRPKGSGWILIL